MSYMNKLATFIFGACSFVLFSANAYSHDVDAGVDPVPVLKSQAVLDYEARKAERAELRRSLRDLDNDHHSGNSYQKPVTEIYDFKMTVARAMEMMFPSRDWNVVIGPSIEPDRILEWKINRHESPVKAITSQNNISIAINKTAKRIGVSRDSETARSLSANDGNAWIVKAPNTLKNVIEEWADKAGYNGVKWEPKHDYKVSYPAVIIGSFEMAITELLKSVAGDKLPLMAEEMANKVIHIKKGGWQAP